MIDIEDKVTGEEIDFYSDVGSIREISDRCQDAAMAYHDEDEWYEAEQLLLKDSAKMFADQKDDMFLISEQTPFDKTVLEAIGVTARPADSDSADRSDDSKAPSGELDDLKEIFFDMEDMLMEKSVLVGLAPESMTAVSLIPDFYFDGDYRKIKVAIVIECQEHASNLNEDAMEAIADAVCDHLRISQNLDEKLEEAGFAAETLDWWSVEINND